MRQPGEHNVIIYGEDMSANLNLHRLGKLGNINLAHEVLTFAPTNGPRRTAR